MITYLKRIKKYYFVGIILTSFLSTAWGLTVINKIVPINSNFKGSLASTIIFSNQTNQPIGPGAEGFVGIDKNTTANIISTAPFCGTYIGFECVTLLPPNCYDTLDEAATLMISGVVTDYGLDLRSLRCFPSEPPEPEAIRFKRKSRSFHHHCC